MTFSLFSNILCEFIRVNDCINNGRKGVIFEGVDKGIWMGKKRQRLQATLACTAESPSTSVPIFNHTTVYPNDNWQTFPSKSIPRLFCYGIIHEYITQGSNLLETSCDSEELDDDLQPVCGNSKAIQRGRLYCISDRIKNLQDNSREDTYYLKAEIQSSFKVNTIYNVIIALNENGNIVNASCQCPASESLNCSHIVALLFKLEEYTLQYGFEPLTCTSKIKEWNQGRKTGNDPSSIVTAEYKKNKSKIVNKNHNQKKVIEFSAQAKSDHPEDANIPAAGFIQRLQQKEKYSMWTNLLQNKYDDYSLDCDEKLTLKWKIEQLKNNLSSSTPGPFEIEVEQNSCQWLNERRYRITASDCKSYFTSKDLSNLINSKLWEETKDISHLPPIAYGRENESTAIHEYLTSINRTQIRKPGLIINNRFPGLGCSPDGLIFENNELLYCIEVKCPYKLRNCSPLNLSEVKNPNSLSYTVKDNQITLKRGHAYYYQIQLTLAILELKYCEFLK